MFGRNAIISNETARVLVVDDAPVIRHAIKKMLTSDFDVLLAEDGETAWKKLVQDEQIKLLITDIEMPGLDGYAFICRIRASDDVRIRDLPIITITGAEDEETKARAYACGATDFITKPLDATQLQARVQAHVKFDQALPITADAPVSVDGQTDTDPLTKLYSGRYFLQNSKQNISAALKKKQDLSLIRLSIDNFKKIYRQYGDETINQLLVWLAKILTSIKGKQDIIARIGGAEFAITLPATGRSEAMSLCDGLRKAIAKNPFKQGKASIAVTISMGLATMNTDRRQVIEELLKLAEQRLSHAKSQGGDRVSVTGLSETMPGAEELVLSALDGGAAPIAETVSPKGIVSPRGEVEELSVAELEELIKRETNKQRFNRTEIYAAGVDGLIGDSHIVELLSVDKALQILANGDADKVEPYLEKLVSQVIPLLDFYNEKKRLGLESIVDILKEAVSKAK
jgi:two-component system, cell cycle response regulator